jgi:hypothetical protein
MYEVFISYRRADSNFHARMLCDLLRRHLGQDKVFIDRDSIGYGERFLDVIAERLSSCAVFLAVMGPQWFNPRKGARPRLFEPNDTVRLEIFVALNRPILVIPLLIGGAKKMPDPTLLPPSIAGLTAINGEVVSDDSFPKDVASLAQIIKQNLAERVPTTEAEVLQEKERVQQLIKSELANTRPVGPRFGQLDADKATFAEEHSSDAEIWRKLISERGRAKPIPKPRGGVEPVLRLADAWDAGGRKVIGDIQETGKIVFHAVGSTGNTRRPADMIAVTDRMLRDFRERDEQSRPAFMFHLGDVIYMFGEAKHYRDQFYVPYRQYPAPIFAIPGNHDGLVVPGTGTSTLEAFIQNFCAEDFHETAAAQGLGRTAQIQPGVYFTFEAPFVRILALYSNILEGPGVISDQSGRFPEAGRAQLEFLEAACKRVKTEKFQGALILAVHHDPYLGGGHEGKMLDELDAVFEKCKVWPHAVLSAHSHSYRRYTRNVNHMQIPYIVAGNGGYKVRPIPRIAELLHKRKRLALGTIVLEACDQQHYGFLRITVDSRELRIEHQPVSDQSGDAVAVDLKSRELMHTSRLRRRSRG